MAYDRRVDIIKDDEIIQALLDAREKLSCACPYCRCMMYESFELYFVMVCPACGFTKAYGELIEE